MSESLIAKITMKTIGLNASKFVNPDGSVTPVAQIYGIAQKIQVVTDNIRGDSFESIRGQFEAVNMETGEVYQSGTLYLPAGIHDLVASSVKQLDPDDRKAAIRFKLEIGVVKSTNLAGYSYEARNLVRASEVDPLAELRSSGGEIKLLPKGISEVLAKARAEADAKAKAEVEAKAKAEAEAKAKAKAETEAPKSATPPAQSQPAKPAQQQPGKPAQGGARR